MIGDSAQLSLLTGLPGAGKSLRLVQAIVNLTQKGEHVFACNINGLKVPGVTPWEDPRQWRELPPNSILFVDEAQEFFPARRSGEPPEYIRALSKLRHSGHRIILATQQPDYLDSYVRGLVAFHEHLYRISGKAESFIFRNHQVMEQVRVSLKKAKSLYDYETWKHPKQFFAYYTSAVSHTIKYVMPSIIRKALWIVPLAAAMFGGVWFWIIGGAVSEARGGDHKEAGQNPAGSVPPHAARPSSFAASSSSGTASSGGQNRVQPASVEEMVEQFNPRFPVALWSAPIFDRSNSVVAKGETYCVASGAGETVDGYRDASCTCLTDQGTRYELPEDKCRDIATRGGLYNPYKAPLADEPVSDGKGREQGMATPSGSVLTPAMSAITSDRQVTGYGDIAVRTESAP